VTTYLAVDVHYPDDHSGHAAGVLFHAAGDERPAATYTTQVAGIAAYVPGQFYLREMPCILAIIAQMSAVPAVVIVDGYVDLDVGPGLGRRLFDECAGTVAVIGVAKTAYAGAVSAAVLRGQSTKPLYVSAAGLAAADAAHIVKTMHGPHRMPTLLTWVDQLARGLR